MEWSTSGGSNCKDCNEKCCPEGTEQYKLGHTENQECTDKCGYIVRFSNINSAAYEGLVCLSIEKPENHEDQKSFNVEVNVSGEKMFDLYGNGSIENKNIYFYKK